MPLSPRLREPSSTVLAARDARVPSLVRLPQQWAQPDECDTTISLVVDPYHLRTVGHDALSAEAWLGLPWRRLSPSICQPSRKGHERGKWCPQEALLRESRSICTLTWAPIKVSSMWLWARTSTIMKFQELLLWSWRRESRRKISHSSILPQTRVSSINSLTWQDESRKVPRCSETSIWPRYKWTEES